MRDCLNVASRRKETKKDLLVLQRGIASKHSRLKDQSRMMMMLVSSNILYLVYRFLLSGEV